MFSLLVGLNDGVVPTGRLLEHTDAETRESLGADVSQSLYRLPALSMPERGDDRLEQVARVGTVTGLRKTARGHVFTFTPNPNLAPIPSLEIEKIADRLGVDSGGWEFIRTHWAVKDVDLFEVLLEHHDRAERDVAKSSRESGAVAFPVDTPRDPNLVAVMMPFAPEFDVVYETIEAAVADAGLSCARAKDIWVDDHIMADVRSLLWRSQIVVADLTGRNANVFYEAGLAHALPRRTILLAQQSTDVPFDLQAIRYLLYGLGTEERSRLRKQLSDRLVTLIAQLRV